MTEKRFERYLLDGGFTFGDEYIKETWGITDTLEDSAFTFLEFDNKDLCDEIVTALNNIHEDNVQLRKELRNLRRLANEIYMEGSE